MESTETLKPTLTLTQLNEVKGREREMMEGGGRAEGGGEMADGSTLECRAGMMEGEREREV